MYLVPVYSNPIMFAKDFTYKGFIKCLRINSFWYQLRWIGNLGQLRMKTDAKTSNRILFSAIILAVLSVFILGCSEGGTSNPLSMEPAAETTNTENTETIYSQYPNYPIAWWPAMSLKPDSWYQSEEGIQVAENILSWQDEATGGWPLMNTTREMNTGDPNQAGPWGTKGALVGSTVSEIRFLARAYQSTGDERYETALIDGIHFILNAQYPSGGWPHVYPVPVNSYHRYATYNDNEMNELLYSESRGIVPEQICSRFHGNEIFVIPIKIE